MQANVTSMPTRQWLLKKAQCAVAGVNVENVMGMQVTSMLQQKNESSPGVPFLGGSRSCH
jgi:hypothetical protein